MALVAGGGGAVAFFYCLRHPSDAYHAHDFETLVWLAPVAKIRRKFLIYDAHELRAHRSDVGRSSRWITFVEGQAIRGAHAVIATTESRLAYLSRTYRLQIPTIILQNRPEYCPRRESDALREELGISSGLPIVLYQGMMHTGRGIEVLIEVAERVCDAAFVLIGKGNLFGWVEVEIARRNLSKRVYLLPAVPYEKLHDLTSSADIGIHLLQNTCLNHYTTDSNKLFEYIMAGLAVVMPDFPEIRKVVNAAGCGLLVDPADQEQVISQLNLLLKDPQRLCSCKSASVAAARDWSWERQADKLVDLYRGLGAGKA